MKLRVESPNEIFQRNTQPKNCGEVSRFFRLLFFLLLLLIFNYFTKSHTAKGMKFLNNTGADFEFLHIRCTSLKFAT